MLKISREELIANELLQINDWYKLSSSYELTEDIIREFKDKVDWIYICKYQKLTELFIEEFKDYVFWDMIQRYRELSPEFELKHTIELNYSRFMNNRIGERYDLSSHFDFEL